MNTNTTTEAREKAVLDALARHEGFPVSTTTVRDTVHPSITGCWVLMTLHKLAERGAVDRFRPCASGYYWRV